MWKCKNLECGRTFPLTARISTERKPVQTGFVLNGIRIIVDKPCCPFCESLEFEEIVEKKATS